MNWIRAIEAPLVRLGKLESVEIVLSLLLLLSVTLGYVDTTHRYEVLISGIAGIVLYELLELGKHYMNRNTGDLAMRGGMMGFIYLEVLDASFSLDGVVGAFAITKDVVLIAIGLGVGAMFVRSITLYLVRKGALQNYVFLEHGAHYAVGSLAVLMLLSLGIDIPEWMTGIFGALFIVAAMVSSIRYRKAMQR